MTSTPLITTVIPTYRRPALVQRAIASALEQEGPSLVVRVFDNASGDETDSVVTGLSARDPRLLYYRHESNIGAAANFEFGMRSVATPFFSLLSDDDYLLPGFYRRALQDLNRHPDAMFWAGVTLNVDEQGKIWDARVYRWAREGLFTPPEGVMAMMHGMAPVWTGIVFRREVLNHIGFPDREALGPSDLDFILRAATRYKYILCKHPSAVITLNRASFSATEPLSSFWPGWQKMFHNIGVNEALNPESKTAVLEALHHDAKRMLFRRGANALSMRRYDFARDAAKAFKAQYGSSPRLWILEVFTQLCARVPLLQRGYTRAYRWAESRLVKSRADLELHFGSLVRRV